MRVVLDSNVLLAGFGTRGLCEAVVETVLSAHALCLGEYILVELAEHLGSKFRLPPGRITEIVAFLKSHATLHDPAEVPPGACRDPNDLPILGIAVAAGADCIVTGDKDLLSVGEYEGIAIDSPRAFLERAV